MFCLCWYFNEFAPFDINLKISASIWKKKLKLWRRKSNEVIDSLFLGSSKYDLFRDMKN